MNQVTKNKLIVATYYKAIPLHNKNAEKPMILDYFCEGVNKCNDIAIAHRELTTVPCDVALIQGYVHEHGKTAPHLKLRKEIIELQKQHNKKSIIVDSSLFLYVDTKNPQHYLRYSFNGVFPTTGFYFDTEVDSNRWSKISKNLNITLKPYRSQGNHILICLQRNGGWSMGGHPVAHWLESTIRKIKSITTRPIIVRPHPNDRKIMSMLRMKFKNVKLSTSPNLLSDLTNAWATVVYNSSPSVASIIEGVPAFITDPEPRHSQSYTVANTDLNQIENPILHERQLWIEKLAMCHWNFDELRSGEAWTFFKKYI